MTHQEKKDQFKDQVTRLYSEELIPIPEVAKRLGISVNMAREIMRQSGKIRCAAERRAASINQGHKNFTTGYFHSSKSGKWFPAASSYEFLRMKQLDENPRVLAWDRNVPWIRYGQNRRYVPDFFVTYTDGQIVVEEVKPAFQTNNLENIEKWKAAKEQLAGMGIVFRVVTENEIGWDNIKNFKYEGFASLSEAEKLLRKAEYRRQYREANKKRIREWHRMARINDPKKYQNKDKLAVDKYRTTRKAYRANHYSENRIEIIEKVKAWCAENTERRKQYMKEYYLKNKHKLQVMA